MTPWSPPKWMKTNATVYGGGSLRSDMKSKYAVYLAKNLRFFDSLGSKIDFFSLQNEPLQDLFWQSCTWSSTDYTDMLKNYVKPAFQVHGLSPKFFLVKEKFGTKFRSLQMY